jgi:hypothetical protein
VNLDTYDDPADLYLARGEEVNPNRPIFTGDVFDDVAIADIQTGGLAIIVAHPCSFRVGGGQLRDRLLAAPVHTISKQGKNAWSHGHLGKMPLPDLTGAAGTYMAACFDDAGQARTANLQAERRVACLSEFGINMLQQRFVCSFSRVEVPTHEFSTAFSHTYAEADLLEDWTDALTADGWTANDAASEFEKFIRSGERTYQDKLREPQLRSAVRKACKQEVARLLGDSGSNGLRSSLRAQHQADDPE